MRQFFDEDRLCDIWNKEYDFFLHWRNEPNYTPDMKPLTEEEIKEKNVVNLEKIQKRLQKVG